MDTYGKGSDSSACNPPVTAAVSNLTLSGRHGFHVPTYVDLSSGDGVSSAMRITTQPSDDIAHGYHDDQERQLDGFENLTASTTSNADYSRTDKAIRLSGNAGHLMIIHAEADNLGC